MLPFHTYLLALIFPFICVLTNAHVYTYGCLGMPWMVAATVRSIAHVNSLKNFDVVGKVRSSANVQNHVYVHAIRMWRWYHHASQRDHI